jgi:hypothetical protein
VKKIGWKILATGTLLAAALPGMAKVTPTADAPRDLSMLQPPLAIPVQPLTELINTSNILYDRFTDPAYVPARQLQVTAKTAQHLAKEKDKTACTDGSASVDIRYNYPAGQAGPVLARLSAAGWCRVKLPPGSQITANTNLTTAPDGLLLASNGSYWIGQISFPLGRLQPSPSGNGVVYDSVLRRFMYGDASLWLTAKDKKGPPSALGIADQHGNLMVRTTAEPLFPRKSLYLRALTECCNRGGVWVRQPLQMARVVMPEIGQLSGMVASEVGMRLPREQVANPTQHFTRFTALDGSFAITGSFKLDSAPAAPGGLSVPLSLPIPDNVQSVQAYRDKYLVETQMPTKFGPAGRYLFDGTLNLPRASQGLAAMLASGTVRPARAEEVKVFEGRLTNAMTAFAPLEKQLAEAIAFYNKENARMAAKAKADANRKSAERAAFGQAWVEASNQVVAQMKQDSYQQNYNAQVASNRSYAASQSQAAGRYIPPAMPAFTPYEMKVMDDYRQMVRDGRISAADHARWQNNQLRANEAHQARVRRITERSQADFAARAATDQRRMNDRLKIADSSSVAGNDVKAAEAAAKAERDRLEQGYINAQRERERLAKQKAADAERAKAEQERRERDAAIEAQAVRTREANARAQQQQEAQRRAYQPVREAIAVCNPDGSGKSDHFRCWGPIGGSAIAVNPRQTSGWQSPDQWLNHASGCKNPRRTGSTTDGGVVFYCGYGLTSFALDVYSLSGFRGGNGLTYYCRVGQPYCRHTSVPAVGGTEL